MSCAYSVRKVNDEALKIGLPIVLILLTLAFIAALMKGLKNDKGRTKDYEMANQNGRKGEGNEGYITD